MEEKNQKISRKRKRKLRKIWKHALSALSCLVVFCTTYALILPAITAETKTYCDKEEHTHTENCYRSDDLLCDLEESDGAEAHSHNDTCYEVKKELICSEAENEEHTHNEGCYKEEKTLICTKEETKGEKGHEHSINCYRSDKPLCEKEEHTHDRMCYSNQDLKEKEEDWKKSLPKNLDKLETLNEKLAAIANSQKGYEEVKENYIEDEETNELKYYTRYGEWYGKPYEDWNIMFTSFVLRYAGINQTEIPWGQDWDEWVKLLSKKELVVDNTYEPINGDIVLLKDKEDKNNPDKEINAYSGFIYGKEEEKDKITYKAIIGDFEDKVKEVLLKDKDYEILGYIHPKDESKKDEENNEDETDKDDSDKEENPDEEDKENKPSEDDLLKPEEPEESEKIEYQLPEYFLYENEDFTLKLTPIINGKDTMGEDLVAEGEVAKTDEDNLKGIENSKKQENAAINSDLADSSLDGLSNNETKLDTNINQKLEEEYSLSEKELTDIKNKNIDEKNKKSELPIPTLKVIALNEEDDDKEISDVIKELKSLSLENIEEEQILDLSYYQLQFLVDDKEIELSDVSFNAEITPTAEFIEKYDTSDEFPDAVEEAEIGTEFKILQTEPRIDSILLNNESSVEKSYSLLTSEDPSLNVMLNNNVYALRTNSPVNVNFSVQTYGYLSEKVKSKDSNGISVYDFSSNIPSTGTEPPVAVYALEDITEGTHKIKTQIKSDPEVIYAEKNYSYHSSPNLNYFDILADNSNYNLKEIWKLKPNRNSSSISRDDWEIYSDYQPGKIVFTNRPETAEETNNEFKYVLISEGTVLRLVYEETYNGNVPITAQMYDYDVTTKVNGKNYIKYNNSAQGINSPSNYLGNGGAKYAFGNGDLTTPTGLNNELFGGKTINVQQGIPVVTGMVNGYNDKGNLLFSQSGNGIDAPVIFGKTDKNVVGRYDIGSADIAFKRTGDSYTINSISGDSIKSIPNLDVFSSRDNWNNTRLLYSNYFFPLDTITNVDGHTGTGNKTLDSEKYYIQGDNSAHNYSPSDDYNAHNNFFGMTLDIKFTLDEDYEGPLKYFFFGDDDMWVFLVETDENGVEKLDTQKLICDLGGVKGSVGGFVDLREKYLPLNKQKSDGTKHYKLKIFYTERGLSGSTCYMDFILPKLSGTTPEQKFGNLRIHKETTDEDYSESYSFLLNFKDSNNKQLYDAFSYTIYDKDNQRVGEPNIVIANNDIITLKKDQYAVIEYLPIGTIYSISEILKDGSNTSVETSKNDGDYQEALNVNSRPFITGTIEKTGSNNAEIIKFLNKRHYQLPETGSNIQYSRLLALGISLMLTSLFIYVGISERWWFSRE